MEVDEEMLKKTMQFMGSKGGKNRAKKVSAKRLSEIGNLGGAASAKVRTKKAAAKKKSEIGALQTSPDPPYPFPPAAPLRLPSSRSAKAK